MSDCPYKGVGCRHCSDKRRAKLNVARRNVIDAAKKWAHPNPEEAGTLDFQNACFVVGQNLLEAVEELEELEKELNL